MDKLKALVDAFFGKRLGGALCSIYASFSFGDLMQTALMAVVWTLVSYVTSRLLGKIKSKMK
ncbi:hypothetical protein FM120_36785 [Sphingobacterium faecium PCAi_F2.5]|nr:hypothetical protein FM120_36785 [Sphingobacterium faecium PCAi_F2.5]